MRHALPELAQRWHAIVSLVTGDERSVDRPDRCSNHPVGFDAGLVQRLVDTGLIGAERAATLQHHDDAPRTIARLRRIRSIRSIGPVAVQVAIALVAHVILPGRMPRLSAWSRRWR